MFRVVFDTVFFVRSLLNPQSFWGQILFQYSRRYILFVSQPVLIEILEVLRRPELINKFQSISGRDINRVLEIISEAEIVQISDIPPVSRDPKDDKFLATAKVAGANYIVSADKDLLDLKKYEDIQIIDAETFIKILEE